jgi:hypothetical protein
VQAFGDPSSISKFAIFEKNPDVFLYASGRMENIKKTLKDMLRALGLRAMAIIKAHELIMEIPLADVQRIS